MIRPEDIRDYLDRKPFEPFRLFVSDGATFDVRHPEMCLLSRATMYVGRPAPNTPGVADGVTQVALVHVTRIESLNGSGSPPPTRKRSVE